MARLQPYLPIICVLFCFIGHASAASCSAVCTVVGGVLQTCTGQITDLETLDCKASDVAISDIAPNAFDSFDESAFPNNQSIRISLDFSDQLGLARLRKGVFSGMSPHIWVSELLLSGSGLAVIDADAFEDLNSRHTGTPSDFDPLKVSINLSNLKSSTLSIADRAFAGLAIQPTGTLFLPDNIGHLGVGAFRGAVLPALKFSAPKLTNVSEDCFRDLRIQPYSFNEDSAGVEISNLFADVGGGEIHAGAFAGIHSLTDLEAGAKKLKLSIAGHITRIHSHAFESAYTDVDQPFSIHLTTSVASQPAMVSARVDPLAFFNARVQGRFEFGVEDGTQIHAHWHFEDQALACMHVGLDRDEEPLPGCLGLNAFPLVTEPFLDSGSGTQDQGTDGGKRVLKDSYGGNSDGGAPSGKDLSSTSTLAFGASDDLELAAGSTLVTASFQGRPFFPAAHFARLSLGALNMTDFPPDSFSGLSVSPVFQPQEQTEAQSQSQCLFARGNTLPLWQTGGDSVLEVVPLTVHTNAFRGAQLFCTARFRVQQPDASAATAWNIRVMPHAFNGTISKLGGLLLQGALDVRPNGFAGMEVLTGLGLHHSNLVSPNTDNVDPATLLRNDIFQGTTMPNLLVFVQVARQFASPPYFLRGCSAGRVELHFENNDDSASAHGSFALDSLHSPRMRLIVQGVLSFATPPAPGTLSVAAGLSFVRNVTVGEFQLITPAPPTVSFGVAAFSTVKSTGGLGFRFVLPSSFDFEAPAAVFQCPNDDALVPPGGKAVVINLNKQFGLFGVEPALDFNTIGFLVAESGGSGGSKTFDTFPCSCPAGRLPETVGFGHLCVPCPAGSFCNDEGLFDCPAGTFNERTGATSAANCTQCAPGTYSEVQGATVRSCNACPVGTFLNATGGSSPDQCTRCPAGTYASFTGSPTCTPCPQGTYSDASGARQCIACPLDTYGTREGGSSLATACRACPSGSGTFSVGTGSPAGCIGSAQLASIQGPVAGAPTCAAGESNAVDGTCVPCPLGHACPSGIALPCPAGAYSNRRGLASLDACEQCPAGSFNPIEGQTSVACVPCPSGTASSAAGAVDSAACVDCAPGYASLLPGQSVCSACSIGTYAAGSGSRQCTSCPANTFGSRQAATSASGGCAACPPGTDTAGLTGATSSAACRAVAAAPPATCGPNQVRDSEDASVCVDVVCGAGTVLQGAVCVGCAAGTFGDPGDAAVGCTACPPGQVCPGGTFSAIVTPERVSTSSAQLQESAVQAQETVPAQSESQGSAGGIDVNVLIFGSTVLLAVLLPVLLLVMSSLCSKRTRDVLESADTFTTDHDYSDGRAIVKKGTVLGGACTVCMGIIIIGFIAASAVQYATRNTLVSTRFDPAGTAITSTGAVKSDWVMDVAAMVEGVATSGDCPQPSGVLRFEGGKAGAGAGGVNSDWRVAAAARVSSAQPGPSLAPSSICTYRAECTGCALESTLRVRVRLPFTAQSTSWSLRSRRATSGDTEGLPVYSLVKGVAGATSTQRLRSSAWTLSATREVLQDSRSGGDDVYGYLLALVDQSIVYLDGSTAVSGFVPAATPVQLSIDVQVAPAASVIAVSALQTPLGLIAALGGLVGAIIGIFRFVYGESEQYVQGALVAVGWLRRQDQWAESEEGGDVLKPLPGKSAGAVAGFMYVQNGHNKGRMGINKQNAGGTVQAKSGRGGGSMSSTVLAAPPADANGRTVLDVDDAEAAYGGVHANPVSLGVSDSQSVMTDDRGSAWSS